MYEEIVIPDTADEIIELMRSLAQRGRSVEEALSVNKTASYSLQSQVSDLKWNYERCEDKLKELLANG